MLACKWRGFSLSVLTYPKLRSAPVLKPHHFRLRTAQISLPYGWGGGLRCNFYVRPVTTLLTNAAQSKKVQ
ncbi:hypothetical protein F9K88_07790 [Brucella intermedia]|nr:hypothetical protein F9K88_07790 [Brucella intermedia]